MKNKIFSTVIICAILISSCQKSQIQPASLESSKVWNGSTTNGLGEDPIVPLLPKLPIITGTKPILAPGQTEYCIPNQAEFYAYVWGLPYGAPAICPYYSFALKSVKITFSDGNVIFCSPIVINRFGDLRNGGAALQDLNCTAATGGFLTNIVLTYFDYSGAQGIATFPLYSCDYNAAGYPTGYSEIRMLKAGIAYILHSTITTFSYPVSGIMLTKTIKIMEFI